MLREPRPHQVKALDGIRSALVSGSRRMMLDLPTGAGKTVVAAHIVAGARAKGNRLVFCVPSLSLIGQTFDRFQENGIDAGDMGIIQADHPWTRPHAPVQIASAQTLARRELPITDLVVIDECFAAGTLILTPKGEIPIESLKIGDKIVSATGNDSVVATSVRRAVVRRVRLSNGRYFDITRNHRVFTDDGWVPAWKLEVGSRLYGEKDLRVLWSSVRSQRYADAHPSGSRVERDAFLLDILRKEIQQPDAQRVGSGEDVEDIASDRSRSKNPWREWSRHDGAAEAYPGNTRDRMGRGIGDSDESSEKREALSDLLPGGFGQPQNEDSDRIGRTLAQREAKASGREERRVSGWAWVESVEAVERECDVYNLHVARHPSYFASGILVHNCHVRMKVYERWMQAKPELPFIGLSATPWATGLGKLYDTLIKPVSLADLIEQGYLSPFRAYAPSHPDLSGVKISHGDYQEDELGEAMSKPTLVADVVATWLEKGRGRPTLCFAVNRNHAAKLAYEFNKAGVRVAYVDAFTTRDEREEIGRKFAALEIEVVVNIGVLTTGIDWDVRCLILARPTKSEMLYVQIVGRALRTAAGKDYALILDHSDTMLSLGLPTEIHHERLSMGKADDAKAKAEKDKKPSTPKVCKACSCLLAPRQRECGECGMPQFGATGVIETAGELVELGAGKGRGEKPKPITERLAAMGKREIYGMLKTMERRAGWKHGVIEHRFRDIFGVWARGLRDAPAIEPCFELQSWIRSRNIAWAKSKGRVT